MLQTPLTPLVLFNLSTATYSLILMIYRPKLPPFKNRAIPWLLVCLKGCTATIVPNFETFSFPLQKLHSCGSQFPLKIITTKCSLSECQLFSRDPQILSWVLFYRKESLGFLECDSIDDFVLLLAVTFESYFYSL